MEKNKIINKLKKYKKPKIKKTFDELCFPKKYEVQNSQKIPAVYLEPGSPYKTLLVFHKIGSGKTCAAIQIAEKWKYKRKILFVCPSSLIINFRDELRTQCADNSYITEKERAMIKKIKSYQDPKYKSIIQKSDDMIDKHYEIYSHKKFIMALENNEISFKKKILIIDEIQNMVSLKGKYYKVLSQAIKKSPDDLRIILLSATPMFDQPYEIGLTMNLLKIPKLFPVKKNEFESEFLTKNKKMKNVELFKKMTQGYVSYYGGGDKITLPKANIKYLKCDMGEFQYTQYMESVKKLKLFSDKREGKAKEIPIDFLIGPRVVSNVAFPNKKFFEEGISSVNKINLENIKTYSSKISKMIENIKKSEGKIYIYSNFTNYYGIKLIIILLEKLGYVNYADYGEGNNRYALWTGNETLEYKAEIKTVYNKESNNKGDLIKILILSPSGKEGLSLFSVREAHILEPYWNKSRMDQIIGRGVRFCSHKLLPPNERKIDVYIYLATKGKKLTVDTYIVDMMDRKDKTIKQFERVLMTNSIEMKN